MSQLYVYEMDYLESIIYIDDEFHSMTDNDYIPEEIARVINNHDIDSASVENVDGSTNGSFPPSNRQEFVEEYL